MTAPAQLPRGFSGFLVVLLAAVIIQAVAGIRPPDAPGPALLRSAPAAAAACGPGDVGCKLYTGQSGLLQQVPKPFSSPMRGHGETATILWNGRWLMYYRTFVRPDNGLACQFPTGIALAASADGGASWQAQDGGRPLSTLQSVMPGGCAESTAVNATELYAPDVIVDGSRLLMVFERRDT